MNKDSLKAYSELINQLWESVGKKKWLLEDNIILDIIEMVMNY